MTLDDLHSLELAAADVEGDAAEIAGAASLMWTCGAPV